MAKQKGCPACDGRAPKYDRCECGELAPHTHHDYPGLTLDCEFCDGPCSQPVPVYSCACGMQFVYGEFGPKAAFARFDNYPPCWAGLPIFRDLYAAD